MWNASSALQFLEALLLLKIADILQISSLFEAMGRRIEVWTVHVETDGPSHQVQFSL